MNHTLRHSLFFSLFIIIFSVSFSVYGQVQKHQSDPGSDSIAVVQTIHEFVDAFSILNWQKFTEFFSDDATAFFPPSAKSPFRANNKVEIENIFKRVFENARKQKSAPPYIDIQPNDLKIQIVGEVAIVTFVLNDPDLFGRRTIILRKINDKWFIIHLHASGVIIPKNN